MKKISRNNRGGSGAPLFAGISGFVCGSRNSSNVLINHLRNNEISFISDSVYRKGEKISVQLNRKVNNEIFPIFLNATIKDVYLSYNFSRFNASIC